MIKYRQSSALEAGGSGNGTLDSRALIEVGERIFDPIQLDLQAGNFAFQPLPHGFQFARVQVGLNQVHQSSVLPWFASSEKKIKYLLDYSSEWPYYFSVANIKYFSDWNGETLEVMGAYSIKNTEFALLFPGVKGLCYDSFSKRVARVGLTVVPLTRVIEYKKNPSLHECNDRCLGAKPNGCCECRCGGANHGKGRV